MNEISEKKTLTDLLAFMQAHGSSVLLNWGEDNDNWECSWITSGRRYSGFKKDPMEAAREAYYNARTGNEDVSS